MAQPAGMLGRALRNVGLLLSSKVLTGVMQLATFAVIARGLGPVEFGYFALLQTHVQFLSGFATVQSNQAVIHYGVKHLGAEDLPAFQAVLKAGSLMDVAGAVLAMLLAVALAPAVAGFLEWDERIVFYAQCFAPLALANAIATPKGMLRLFGRFDLLARHVVVTPAVRLVGSAVAFLLEAPLGGYLVVWFVAGYAGAAVAIWMAWRQAAGKELLAGFTRDLRGLSRPNPGIWRFMAISNVHSTLALVPNYVSVFLVGGLVGPAAAGLYKVAREIGTGLGKPVDLLNQAIYPDLTRLAAARDWRSLGRIAVRSGMMAGAVGAALFLVIVLAGDWVVGLLFGAEFVAATPVLTLLMLSTAISVTVFAAEPVLYALGRPGVLLGLSVVINGTLFASMAWLLHLMGLIGAGWASVATALLNAVLAAGFTVVTMRATARRAERQATA
ncbi:lipopolysaccharide biosynthesis protein [Arenibaculum pallidiluteum]|uniref:lipopolysaccharide biosynthesis protein n=1 Tax=Arenibaculum pallidiluteum TaxID=2812559 RepID=UPI001A96AA5E|nr:lipopolysaccharide biosynthesis protein [Arenibaculum pallidiluteum]